MKGTILVTAVIILAFNIHTGRKKSASLPLQNIGTYIETIAAKDKALITSSVETKEDTFVSCMINGKRREIIMADMARQKSTSPQIKALAQHLVDDHQQLLNALEKLNNSGNEMDKMNDLLVSSKGENMAYSNLSGDEFDRKWVSDMIMEHAKTINDFKTELSKTQNVDLKSLITKSLPIISEHLRWLGALRNKMM